MTPLNRRTFVAAGSAFAASLALSPTEIAQAQAKSDPAPGQLAAGKVLMAGEVIERIKKNIGVPWFSRTVDNLLTATPETPVKGIATTMMATLEVVQHCAEQGLNMIVTHETPFYLHQDHIEDIKSDPTLLYKLDYCRQHEIAIFHFHDHWHARHPDGIAQGLVTQLGWQKNIIDPANPRKLQFDGIPLAQFTDQMRRTLNARSIRVLGDPALPVHHVTTSWGYMGREVGIPVFASPDTDVLICGETREWELVEYCQDSIRAGNKKALIVVGHILSEQGGMILAADWLKSFITEVPIKFVPAPEPFWIAGQPPTTA